MITKLRFRKRDMSKRIKALQDKLELAKSLNAPKEVIEEIEGQIMRSTRSSKSRKKGASYENTIAKKIMKVFPKLELSRTPMSGGFQKNSTNETIRGDISNLNEEVDFGLHVECKNAKTWKLKDWIAQASGDCPKGKVPIVVFHQQQAIEDGKVTQPSEDYVCISLKDFLGIVDNACIVREK